MVLGDCAGTDEVQDGARLVNRVWLVTLLELVGLALIVTGGFLFGVASGIVVLGGVLLAVGWTLDRDREI